MKLCHSKAWNGQSVPGQISLIACMVLYPISGSMILVKMTGKASILLDKFRFRLDIVCWPAVFSSPLTMPCNRLPYVPVMHDMTKASSQSLPSKKIVLVLPVQPGFDPLTHYHMWVYRVVCWFSLVLLSFFLWFNPLHLFLNKKT